jgi:hypothetical protein
MGVAILPLPHKSSQHCAQLSTGTKLLYNNIILEHTVALS